MNQIMHSDPIVIVGSVALDTIEVGSVRYTELLGGAATYATIAAGRFAKVSPVGIVGEDFPAQGMNLFKKYSDNLNDLKTTMKVEKNGIHFLLNSEFLRNLIRSYP